MINDEQDQIEELEQRLREVEAERDGYAQALRMLAAGADAALRVEHRRRVAS